MTFKTLIPATDWFYVHKQIPPTKAPVVYHVAAFALQDDDEVVGLIPVATGNKGLPRLVKPPADVDGVYLHRDQLTEEEANLARSTR
jgi:hypothetical protein